MKDKENGHVKNKNLTHIAHAKVFSSDSMCDATWGRNSIMTSINVYIIPHTDTKLKTKSGPRDIRVNVDNKLPSTRLAFIAFSMEPLHQCSLCRILKCSEKSTQGKDTNNALKKKSNNYIYM